MLDAQTAAAHDQRGLINIDQWLQCREEKMRIREKKREMGQWAEGGGNHLFAHSISICPRVLFVIFSLCLSPWKSLEESELKVKA